jgi:hypothetical protein
MKRAAKVLALGAGLSGVGILAWYLSRGGKGDPEYEKSAGAVPDVVFIVAWIAIYLCCAALLLSPNASPSLSAAIVLYIGLGYAWIAVTRGRIQSRVTPTGGTLSAEGATEFEGTPSGAKEFGPRTETILSATLITAMAVVLGAATWITRKRSRQLMLLALPVVWTAFALVLVLGKAPPAEA